MSIQWFDREALDKVVIENVQKVDVVLDIGCGIRPQTFFRPRVHICCEPHPEYVRILQNRFADTPSFVILQGSAQETSRFIPDQSVDSIFLIDVIEHLKKEDGRRLLQECERIARKQVVVFTPLGFMPQEYEDGENDGWGLHGGELQEHKSGWMPQEFDETWEILASKAYHVANAKGESFDTPFGAFWAIKNIRREKVPKLPFKLAVVSHILPPSPSGQAVVLYRLFKEFSHESYCLLSREKYDAYHFEQNSTSRLPACYHQLAPEFQFKRPNRFGLLAVRLLLNALMQVTRRARNIAHLARREKCEAILACSGTLFDLPAAYLASRLLKVPFYAYFFDDYLYQWPDRLRRLFVRCVEPFIVKGAAGIIVPNEFLRDEYRSRYQVEAKVIHNPCGEEGPESVENPPWPTQEGDLRIVYTGAVYHAHYDAFRNLVAAIRELNRPDLSLHLYTAQARDELESENIAGPVVYHSHLAPSSAFSVQKHADILFLPLAFGSKIPEVIKTSSPGKMGEYLASGRPILVHAPADSFVSSYFKEHECGIVVDLNDPSILAGALKSIIGDAGLRRRLRARALLRAQTVFSLNSAQSEFVKFLEARGEIK